MEACNYFVSRVGNPPRRAGGRFLIPSCRILSGIFVITLQLKAHSRWPPGRPLNLPNALKCQCDVSLARILQHQMGQRSLSQTGQKAIITSLSQQSRKNIKTDFRVFTACFFPPSSEGGEVQAERGAVKRVSRRLLAVSHYLAGSECRLLPLTGRQTTLVAIRSLRQHCRVTCHMPHAACPSCHDMPPRGGKL